MSLRTDQIESWLESVDDYESGDWRPTKESFEWLCQLALKGLTHAKDAERYRFIRTEASHSVNGAWAKIVDPSCNGEDMDAAIDKAMASQATPQSGDDGN